MVSARGGRSGEGKRRGSRMWSCTGRGRRGMTSSASAILIIRCSLGLSGTSSTGISSGTRYIHIALHLLFHFFFSVFCLHFYLPRCSSFAHVLVLYIFGPLLQKAYTSPLMIQNLSGVFIGRCISKDLWGLCSSRS